MVKELIVYPDDRIMATGDVRGFDESVGRLFDDIIDTMKAHNLEALSAMQVAHPFNMFVVKKDDEYLEFANPRILIKDDLFEAPESSSYYPADLSVIVPRYAKMKIVYEDRNGETKYLDIDGDKKFAALFQQMMDFSLGGTILDRIDKKQREQFLNALEGKGLMPETDDVCPTFSKKDYFVSFADKLLFLMGLSLLAPFVLAKESLQTIYTVDKFLFPLVILLMIGFFIYAFYESKKYRQCSSCQVGNNIGVVIKRSTLAIVFAIAIYFLYESKLT
jgi:peptide deformylase